MKITICTTDNLMFFLDINEDMEIESLKTLCETETNIVKDEIVVIHNGKPLLDGKASLRSSGIKDGDIIIVYKLARNIPLNHNSSTRPVPDSQNIPSSVSSNLSVQLNASTFDHDKQMQNCPKEQPEPLCEPQISRIDLESQRLIAEEIRRNNVNDNMEAAIEHNPEAFAVVTMLYIKCKINGADVKAFIDSGAQASLISASCAERCNLMRLVDRRWSGIAKGVGVQKILGRIHMAQVQIENDFLLSSFSVLENQEMDVMLGLDFLRKYECIIDLQRNILRIGSTGTETTFLLDSELPDFAKITEAPNATDTDMK